MKTYSEWLTLADNRWTVRDELQKDLATLKSVYRETREQGPTATVTAFVAAVGYRRAVILVGSLVNRHGWDGRICRKAIEWAAALPDAWDEEAGQHFSLYVDDVIHLAHFDQIARELMKTTPPEDPDKRPETISDDAAQDTQPEEQPAEDPAAELAQAPENALDTEPAQPVTDPAPVPRFTTKSMIIGAERFRVLYSLNNDGSIVISGKPDAGRAFVITLPPDHPHYAAARAAYDEKAEKRAKYDAEEHPAPDKWFIGQELKGNGWTIRMDGSIDRATVTFSRKPSPETRALVKAAGFYWSPVHKQWSRGLTHKAWKAAQDLYSQLKAPAAQRPETISA